jgi:hypothetical protein
LSFHRRVEKLLTHFGERKEVYTAAIFAAEGLRDMGKQALVDVVGDEWSERSQPSNQSVENFEQRIEGYI